MMFTMGATAIARSLIFGAVLTLPFMQPLNVGAEEPLPPESYRWLDVDGQPLPFQDDETIREALRTARILHREKIGVGVAGAEKCLLEIDGLQFHAVFRSIDVMLRQGTRTGVSKPTMKYRDAAIFEAAAYEISDLLGLGRVPPVVERVVESQPGTLQIWMEDTQPEIDLAQHKELNPPDWVRWNQQKAIMLVFDNLIANSDRNKGNLLIDRNWRIWFIDHTRAFKRSPKLLYRDEVTSCERQLWKVLRETDKKAFCMRLKPYLDRPEISYIQTRRHKLIRHIEKLIEKNGEENVLFDLRPPTNPIERGE